MLKSISDNELYLTVAGTNSLATQDLPVILELNPIGDICISFSLVNNIELYHILFFFEVNLTNNLKLVKDIIAFF